MTSVHVSSLHMKHSHTDGQGVSIIYPSPIPKTSLQGSKMHQFQISENHHCHCLVCMLLIQKACLSLSPPHTLLFFKLYPVNYDITQVVSIFFQRERERERKNAKIFISFSNKFCVFQIPVTSIFTFWCFVIWRVTLTFLYWNTHKQHPVSKTLLLETYCCFAREDPNY